MSNDKIEVMFEQECSKFYEGTIEIELNGRKLLGYSDLPCYKSWLQHRNGWDDGTELFYSYLDSLKEVWHHSIDYGDTHYGHVEFVFFFDDGSREIHYLERLMYGHDMSHDETSLNTNLRQFLDYHEFDEIQISMTATVTEEDPRLEPRKIETISQISV